MVAFAKKHPHLKRSDHQDTTVMRNMSNLPSDETIDGATNNIERAIARATTPHMFFMGSDMFIELIHKVPSM